MFALYVLFLLVVFAGVWVITARINRHGGRR